MIFILFKIIWWIGSMVFFHIPFFILKIIYYILKGFFLLFFGKSNNPKQSQRMQETSIALATAPIYSKK